MRLLVTGDRHWRDAFAVRDALEDFLDTYGHRDHVLIHGDARGADSIADVTGQLLGFRIERWPADWNLHGKRAGSIRNQQMLDTGVDHCIAFHDDLGSSRGTRDMVERCEKAGVSVVIVGRDTREQAVTLQ